MEKKEEGYTEKLAENYSLIGNLDSKIDLVSECTQRDRKKVEERVAVFEDNIAQLEENNKDGHKKTLEEVVKIFNRDYKEFIENELLLQQQQNEDRVQGVKADLIKKLKDLEEEIQKTNKNNEILEEESLKKENDIKQELKEEVEELKKMLRHSESRIEAVNEDIIEIRKVYYASFEDLKQENAIVNEKILECEKSSGAILESIGQQEERLKNWLLSEEERESSSMVEYNQKIDNLQEQIREEVELKIEVMNEKIREIREELSISGKEKDTQEQTNKGGMFSMKEVTKRFFNTNKAQTNNENKENHTQRSQISSNGKGNKYDSNISKLPS